MPDVWTVRAVNIAAASENRIHDDATARRLGFSGALVPGVEVYAFATRAAVARWGRAWLERGELTIRLLRPVYAGRLVEVTSEAGDDGSLRILVRSEGVVAAEAAASLPEIATAMPDLAAYPVAVPPAERPTATVGTLPDGLALGSAPYAVTAAVAAEYLRQIEERADVFGAEGPVHPGTVLRICNWVLMHSVRMGAWIHVESRVRHLRAAPVPSVLTGRGRVLRTFERGGHGFVVLDVVVVADTAGAVARVEHTAIFRPRGMGDDAAG